MYILILYTLTDFHIMDNDINNATIDRVECIIHAVNQIVEDFHRDVILFFV